MLKQKFKDLKDYARADYAREIFLTNQHLPPKERWRLVMNSEEHRRRQLFARTRAKRLVLAAIPLLLLALAINLVYGSEVDVHLMIGSYDVGEAVAIGACLVYGVAAMIIAWRAGTKAAERAWAARPG